MLTSYNSQLLDTAVSELSKLPGIGEKTAIALNVTTSATAANARYAATAGATAAP